MSARLAIALLVALIAPLQARAQIADVAILSADFSEPVRRSGHAPMGRGAEWGAITFQLNLCPRCQSPQRGEVSYVLPPNRVFEDSSPRLLDLDGNGNRDAVLVVESDLSLGSRLVLLGPAGEIAATPFPGTARHWIAVQALGDLDGDGMVEMAVVETPHSTPLLKIWRLQGREFVPVAELAGVSNHRAGEAQPVGGLRHCDAGPEIVLLDAGYSAIMAVRFENGLLSARHLGAGVGRRDLRAAMDCRR